MKLLKKQIFYSNGKKHGPSIRFILCGKHFTFQFFVTFLQFLDNFNFLVNIKMQKTKKSRIPFSGFNPCILYVLVHQFLKELLTAILLGYTLMKLCSIHFAQRFSTGQTVFLYGPTIYLIDFFPHLSLHTFNVSVALLVNFVLQTVWWPGWPLNRECVFKRIWLLKMVVTSW